VDGHALQVVQAIGVGQGEAAGGELTVAGRRRAAAQTGFVDEAVGGDPSSATLTITITGSNDGPTLSLVATDSLVDEAGLSSGSAAAGEGEFASGSFTLADTDGLDDLQSVTINGKTVAIGDLQGETFAGDHGTLT
ncbi:hypothetical protein U8L64_00115, partial [Pseudomonas sp. FIP_A4]|uniref:hypothetical protein n=1 Tax=Pseudomonas sp. FIP_A4 TaxID=3070684 RepID=UPI002FD13940